MKHKPFKNIECVGSVAFVSLWEIEKPIVFPHYSLGKWGGAVLGNDSVIVARELKTRGFKIKCRLLNATDTDVKCVIGVLGKKSVVAIDTEKGPTTHSLCLEDTSEQRSWIFSRSPMPSTELGSLDADIVYVDYYKEFVGFLNKNSKKIESGERLVFINLSSVSSISEIPKLAIKPAAVQASVPNSLSLDSAVALALELGRTTSAKNVFVTMGSRGAVLASVDKTWHAKPASRLDNCILGAGALFSSEVIIGLSKGLEQEALVQWSVKQTALRLKSWSKNEINRL